MLSAASTHTTTTLLLLDFIGKLMLNVGSDVRSALIFQAHKKVEFVQFYDYMRAKEMSKGNLKLILYHLYLYLSCLHVDGLTVLWGVLIRSITTNNGVCK